MKTVQRANKQLRVPDERLQEMLNRGYVEVNEKTGKPVKKEPVDKAKALEKEIAELKKLNEELAAQIAQLTEKTENTEE